MSDKILKRLWAVCLIVDGVCAVILGVLSIMGSEPAKPLAPILCVLMLLAVACLGRCRMMKRQKKK